MWKGSAHPVKHIADIGDVVVIDRRIEIDPEQIRRRHGCSNIVGDAERATPQAPRQQSVKAGLKQRRLPSVQLSCSLRRLRKANRRNPARCETRSRDRAEMPKTVDANLHVRASITQGLAIRYSSVFITPFWIDSFGVQPSARIRLQSRKINGLSPIQPRSPPVYSSLGFSCRRSQIQPID